MLNYINIAYSVLTKGEFVNYYPIHLQLEPTNFCNLHCKMCIRNETINSFQHLDYDKFKLIYTKIKPKKITFAGRGEPTLNSALDKMLFYAGEFKTSTMISSNLTVIDKLAENLVLASLKALKISIDAATALTYKKVRGGDYFNKILDGIELINFYKKKYKFNFPEMRFDFVILKDNYHEIPDLINLAANLKIKTIYFRALQSEGISDVRKDDLAGGFNFKDFYKILLKSYKLSKNNKINTNLTSLISDFSNYQSIYLNKNGNFKEICLLPWLQIFVSVEGEVAPCCALYSNTGLTLGNIFKEEFKNIWNGEKFRTLRKDFKEGLKYPVCKDCVPRTLREILKMGKLLPSFIKIK
ncbi:MAG: SPASM domain-containing protein [Armatimonadetes bacterium]|nr:SPASM domain-containing protein [Armatimonadota bacterium]